MNKKFLIAGILVIGTVAAVAMNLMSVDYAKLERDAHRHFLCTETECLSDMTASVGEIAALSKHREFLSCTSCGSRMLAPATPCPACARFIALEPHNIVPNSCPHCEAEINEWNTGAHRHGPNGEHIPDPEFLAQQQRKAEARRAAESE